MSNGWKCPGCGRCYAPFVASCAACDPSAYRTETHVVIGDPLRCVKCSTLTSVVIDGLCTCCYGSGAR